jgi:hypothetical protein
MVVTFDCRVSIRGGGINPSSFKTTAASLLRFIERFLFREDFSELSNRGGALFSDGPGCPKKPTGSGNPRRHTTCSGTCVFAGHLRVTTKVPFLLGR